MRMGTFNRLSMCYLPGWQARHWINLLSASFSIPPSPTLHSNAALAFSIGPGHRNVQGLPLSRTTARAWPHAKVSWRGARRRLAAHRVPMSLLPPRARRLLLYLAPNHFPRNHITRGHHPLTRRAAVCVPGYGGPSCDVCGQGTWSAGGDANATTAEGQKPMCTPCAAGEPG